MFTRKVVLMIALGLTCGSAMAEWTAVGISADEQTVIYADKKSILRKGSIAKMWSLFDFKSAIASPSVKGKFILSSKGQNAYDCSEEKISLLALSNSTKGMGEGDIVYSDYSVKGDWEAIAPDSIYKHLFNIACGKE
jgi:hypothetical protein